MRFEEAFAKRPLIAILRGIAPEEAAPIGLALCEAGFTLIEAPLNGAGALEAIGILTVTCAGKAVIGAGTVVALAQVEDVARAGAQFVVSPNTDENVIRATKSAGLISLPGAMTPSECFRALGAGADGIKLFPAEAIGPDAVRAMRAVLPAGALLIPVGGIDARSMAAYRAAGASGFGFGGSVYGAGRSAEDVGTRARAIVRAWEVCG